MRKIWLLRAVCLGLTLVTLGGCVVVPGRPYRPFYFYR